MVSDRARKFFGGIVSEERMDADLKMVDRVDWDLVNELNEVLWDAFNGRGKHAAKKVKKSKVADEYFIHPEDRYVVDWNEEIERALMEVK